jgi:hypothetical protein
MVEILHLSIPSLSRHLPYLVGISVVRSVLIPTFIVVFLDNIWKSVIYPLNIMKTRALGKSQTWGVLMGPL